MIQITSTPNAPAAIGPYSQAVMANGFLFTSGQVALMPGSGVSAGESIQAQAEQCCKNIQAILEANGLTFKNVVKTTCFLENMEDFAAFNAIYEQYFISKPARSCVAVKELPRQLLCEIEVVAINER